MPRNNNLCQKLMRWHMCDVPAVFFSAMPTVMGLLTEEIDEIDYIILYGIIDKFLSGAVVLVALPRIHTIYNHVNSDDGNADLIGDSDDIEYGSFEAS